MIPEDWILIEDICTYYKVEYTFIEALHEHELIHIKRVERKTYLSIEELDEFEKMRRLHYDMDINLEGLEVIRNLLDAVQQLQNDNLELRNRLMRFK